jgi:hypothetical protein
MTKLDEMWDALAKYQSKADKRGHGDTWAKMCGLRTEKACIDADYAAADDDAGYAAYAAADAVKYSAANAAGYAEYWAQAAIAHINHAIELAEKQNDF